MSLARCLTRIVLPFLSMIEFSNYGYQDDQMLATKLSSKDVDHQAAAAKAPFRNSEGKFGRRMLRIPVVGNWIIQSKRRTVIYFGDSLFGTGEQIILVSGISGGRRYSPAYPGRVLWRCFLGSFDEERRAYTTCDRQNVSRNYKKSHFDQSERLGSRQKLSHLFRLALALLLV
jgi:hypothetical protein